MPAKQKPNEATPTASKCSACNLACRFELIRCDNCFRGVHLTCAKLSKQEAGQLGVYVCVSCKQRGVTEAEVTTARHNKPCAVVFISTCLHHNEDKRRWKRAVLAPPEFPGETIDMKKQCDECDHKCVTAAEILCDHCDVGHHYLCVDLTQDLVDTIDKWYCKPCTIADATLQVTFKQATEPGSNDEPPGQQAAAEHQNLAAAASPASAKRKDLGEANRQPTVKRKVTLDDDEPDPSKRRRQRSGQCESKRQTDSDALTEQHRVVVESLKTQLAAQNQRLAAAAIREQKHQQELASRDKRIAELEQRLSDKALTAARVRTAGDQQALAIEGNADDRGTSHDAVQVPNAEAMHTAAVSIPDPEEHLRMKLLNVVGEEKPDVRHVPDNANRKLTEWMSLLEPEGRMELMKWTVGSPFDVFKDQKFLAKGGQGAVHLVELKRMFAVKKVELATDDPGTLEFLVREGKYAYVLVHKNLLSVLYRYIDGDNAYLVYPFVDGGDVRAIMDRLKRCLTEEEAAFVIREVLDALVYLHSNNVAHRDIKPQNVLTNLKGEIMVADLGLCGDTTQLRVTGVGTPEFLSPELATARQRGPQGYKHDAKVDCWSIGVTLVELLTKRFPVALKNLIKQYAKIRKADFMQECRRVVKAANTNLSEECWAFLARCFVHDSQERASAQELRQMEFVKKAKPEDWKKAVRQVAGV